MEIRIDVGDDLKRVTRSLGALVEKQIPFAAATALNSMGKKVNVAEKREVKEKFPTAKPFTTNSIGQKKARKNDLETVIYVKDIAAAYLYPYLHQGRHMLNSRALLNPKNINLDQYGNIPRNRLSALRGRADVFIGVVKTKSGSISGVWQRLPATEARKATRTRTAKPAQSARLKLLIRFGDALPVRQTFNWDQVATKVVDRTFDIEFGRALAKAIATAGLK